MGTSIEEEIITREETTRLLPESSTDISFIFDLDFHWPPWWKRNIFTLCLQMAHFMAQKVAERKFPAINLLSGAIYSVSKPNRYCLPNRPEDQPPPESKPNACMDFYPIQDPNK
jgi:hypothetical protein